jgi:predicted GNAT family acetyltransferase
MTHVLDNAVWNALNTRQSALAVGGKLARKYRPEFTILAGVSAESPEAFDELKQITASGEVVGLRSLSDLTSVEGWTCRAQIPILQMVCEELKHCRPVEFETLAQADVPAMRELVQLTQPGPFSTRTNEFGTFLGIKDGGKLVAMAGERMKVLGFDEISAVCTHPDYQGRGYARALVFEVARLIQERGNVPFLHVKRENLAGIKSYESIGFKTREELGFFVLSPDK